MLLRLLFLLNDIEIAAVGRILRYFVGYTVGYFLKNIWKNVIFF